jgi:hypothetical protein
MTIQFPAYITPTDIEAGKAESLTVLEATGSKIEAIKYIRSRLGIGLKDAKDFFFTEIDTATVFEHAARKRTRDAAPQLLAALKALTGALPDGGLDPIGFAFALSSVPIGPIKDAIQKARAIAGAASGDWS